MRAYFTNSNIILVCFIRISMIVVGCCRYFHGYVAEEIRQGKYSAFFGDK